MEILYRWIRLAQAGVRIETLFLDRGFQKIALYGFNQIAECILYELVDSKVEVSCIIDKKGNGINIDYPAYKPNEISELQVDAIVMMPVDDYRSIQSDLRQFTSTKIISIEDVLYEL